jgi:hypothetical protein
MLTEMIRNGNQYRGIGTYSGYNEVVVASRTYVENLPHSIEAIFIVDCLGIDGNEDEHLGRAHSAPSCFEAQQNGRNIHAEFLRAYNLKADQHPLLLLRPTNWQQPFVIAPSSEEMGKQNDCTGRACVTIMAGSNP